MPGFTLTHVAVAAAHGQLGNRESAANAVRQILAVKPDYATVARKELEKIWAPQLVEHLIEGLRKAGLHIEKADKPAEAPSPTSSGAHPAAVPPSIAVLPFANLSAEKDQEYFSDGLAEEIINLLAQIAGLKVIARTSAFAFRGKEQDIRAIAEALGVTTILQGSVRRAGSRIRVIVQLINADDGTSSLVGTLRPRDDRMSSRCRTRSLPPLQASCKSSFPRRHQGTCPRPPRMRSF